jgi:alpha-aminoadipate carrier protein LysW
MVKCPQCDAELLIPKDVMEGELVTCPDCGESYSIHSDGAGSYSVTKAEVEAEDWGE